MSVRSERAPLDTGMANLDLNAAMPPTAAPANHVEATIGAAQAADSTLAEANTLSTSHPEHPLKRTIVATIRASLGELCLRKQKATWAPSPEALRAILQCAQRPPNTDYPPHTASAVCRLTFNSSLFAFVDSASSRRFRVRLNRLAT